MDFSFIIPTYNRKEMTSKLIQKILEENIASYEILVIDDCSDDNTVQYLLDRYSKVRVIESDKRRFVAHSRNLGIRESNAETLVFCDSDIDFRKGMLQSFLSDLEKGFNFPIIKFIDGVRMQWETSAFFAVPRSELSRFKENYFDENIGIYGDDNDFFIRGRILNINFLYKDRYTFTHIKHSNSIKKNSYDDLRYYLAHRNSLYLAIKFRGIVEGYTWLRLFNRSSGHLLLAIYNIFCLRFKRAYLLLKGIVWMICNIPKCLLSKFKM
ncbi:MAG: glycosyltransferase [Candidatus Omnitrophica bacterium]|jgi:glycosyltransferase involved in cell wall biosynthesis|nr:glycosyltransferase [Candidatus Omnitrophota bacterium]